MAATEHEHIVETEALRLAFSHPRFELRDVLGRGGMGTVYRAFDRERSEEVALKLLGRMTARAIYRFKHEFRTLAGVSHPNLLALYELLATGNQWFFTAELIPGRDLLSHVRGRAPDASLDREPEPIERATIDVVPRTVPRPFVPAAEATPVTMAEPNRPRRVSVPGLPVAPGPGQLPVLDGSGLIALRASLHQLARGLAALHAAGHLHRDVKPGNVLVTDEGRVVLVDFGVALSLVGDDPFARSIVGTPGYMAPEQAGGGRLTPACDWYAFGVLMFELIAGRRPFHGTNDELMALKAAVAAPPLLSLCPSAPADLAELTDALLARDPALRPGGAQVLARLGGAPSGAPPAIASGFGETTVLVGRDPELARLEALYEQARRGGDSRVAVVAGASGMGKSALCAAFQAHARAQGAVVATGRCFERESVPFKAIDSLMDAIARLIARMPEAEEAALREAIEILAGPFAVLRTLTGSADAAQEMTAPLDPAERKRRLAPALRLVLERLAGSAPLVIVLDDVQWGDADSAMLLAEALAPPWTGRFMLVLACRAGEERSEFLRLLSRWIAIDTRIEVGPLAHVHAVALARQLLAHDGGDAAKAETLAAAAGGSPFYVGELAQRGHEVRAASGAPGAAPSFAVPGSSGLDVLLSRRIETLPPSARALVEVLAVAARPTLASVVARAAGHPGVEQATLILLRNLRLVRLRRTARGEVLEPFHDRVREAASKNLSPEAARDVHRRLAEALGSEGGDAESLAEHLAAAGDPAAAFPQAVRAAEQAMRALAFARAAHWYQQALALRVASPSETRELTTHWGRALALLGRGREAADVLLAAAALHDGVAAKHLEIDAANQLLRCGFVDEGQAILYRVLAELGEVPRKFSVPGVMRFFARRARVQLRGFHFVPRREDELDRVTRLRMDALQAGATGFGYQNPFQGVNFASRLTLVALAAGEPRRIARAIATDAAGYAAADSWMATAAWRQRIRTARRLGEEHGDALAVSLSMSVEAMGYYQRAEFRPVLPLADDSRRILRQRCVGASWETHVAELVAMWTLYFLGRFAELASRAEELAREARERGDLHAEINLDSGLPAMRWLAADRPDEVAAARARILPRMSRTRESPQPYWHVMVGEVLEHLYRGDGERALAAIARASPVFRDTEIAYVPMVRIELLWFEIAALLASRRALSLAGDVAPDQGIERELRARLGRLRRDRLPLGAALATVGDGAFAALQGDHDGAAASWQRARVALENLGCRGHAAAVEVRLGALLGGDEGAALAAQGRAALTVEGVRDPERFARVLVPGG